MKKCVAILLLFLSATSYGQGNQLEYYINAARENSPLLKDYQNQVEQTNYDSLLIKATLKPQIAGSSFNNYAPVIKGWGYDNAITNGANFITLVGVNKLLPNKKNLKSQFESLQLQKQSITNTSKISEQELKRTIITQYITVYGDQLQVSFNEETAALLTKGEAILKKLTEKNVYRQADYLAYLVTLQQQSLVIKQLTLQYKNDYATLNYLCGITDTATAYVQEPAITLNQLPELSSSIFLKQFEIDSLRNINNRSLIDIPYRPKFNLFADAGYNSSLAYKAYKNFGTSFGISAVVPIYDGKQRKLQYKKNDLAENSREQYRDFFKAQYSQQITQLRQQLSATEALLQDINIQLKYAQSLIEVNGKLLEAGEVKIADYILALNNYLTTKNLITQNNINRLQLINQINYWNR